MHPPLRARASAVALLGVLATLSASAEDGTTAALDERLAKGEVVVEFSSVEGFSQPALRALVVLQAPPEQVFAVVDDCAGYPEIMPRVVSAAEVAREGDRSVCTWVVDLPFPMTDLSTEVAATSMRAPGLWTREFKQTRGDFQRNEGRWTLTPFRGDPTRTRLEYRLFVAIDTVLPDAFVRPGQLDGMHGLVEKLQKKLEPRPSR